MKIYYQVIAKYFNGEYEAPVVRTRKEAEELQKAYNDAGIYREVYINRHIV